jgi:hypothetical protein
MGAERLLMVPDGERLCRGRAHRGMAGAASSLTPREQGKGKTSRRGNSGTLLAMSPYFPQPTWRWTPSRKCLVFGCERSIQASLRSRGP